VNKQMLGALLAASVFSAPEAPPPDMMRHGPPRIRSGKAIARTGTRAKERRARQIKARTLRTNGGTPHDD
jgi:hypothetical protein